MTITEFVLDRVDEEEAVARQWMHLPEQRTPPRTTSDLSDVRDPAQLLAECEARRALLHGRFSDPARDETGDEVVRCLAAVYADHHDYNPDWAL